MSVTVCLSTYNSEKYLPQVLEGIAKQKFDKLLLLDNESGDKSVDLVKEKFPDAKVITIPHTTDRVDNIRRMRRETPLHVDTDLIFWVDSDVILPEKAIESSIPYLTDAVGCIGIRYSASTHVQYGATLIRTVHAAAFDHSIIKGRCECLAMNEKLKAEGFSVLWHPSLIAHHLKPYNIFPVESVPTGVDAAPQIYVRGEKIYATHITRKTEQVDEKTLAEEIAELQKQLLAKRTLLKFVQEAKKEARHG